MLLKKLSLILVLMAFVGEARASILLEPYGGYSVGNINALPTSGTAYTSTLQGGAYGGRAGFMLMHTVFLTYEYQALVAGEQQQAKVPASYSWKQDTQFGTLGLQMPFGFRIFGSYGFNVHAVEGTTPNPTTYTGTAAKAGVGWELINHIAVNLEYSIYSLKNSMQNGVTTPMAPSYSRFTYTSGMVNLSIPFTFLHLDSSPGHRHSSSGGGNGGGSGDYNSYNSAPPSPSY